MVIPNFTNITICTVMGAIINSLTTNVITNEILLTNITMRNIMVNMMTVVITIMALAPTPAKEKMTNGKF